MGQGLQPKSVYKRAMLLPGLIQKQGIQFQQRGEVCTKTGKAGSSFHRIDQKNNTFFQTVAVIEFLNIPTTKAVP